MSAPLPRVLGALASGSGEALRCTLSDGRAVRLWARDLENDGWRAYNWADVCWGFPEIDAPRAIQTRQLFEALAGVTELQARHAPWAAHMERWRKAPEGRVCVTLQGQRWLRAWSHEATVYLLSEGDYYRPNPKDEV